jgi:hypothetical protein
MPTLLRPARRRAPTLIGLAILIAVSSACLPPVSRGSGAPGPVAGDSVGPSAALPSGPSGPTPRPSFVPPTPTPAPTFAVYVVKSGDNLNSIAKQFGTSARSIAFWNRSTYASLDPESADYSPNLLKLGWTLFVVPNVILTDDEAPPLPGSEASDVPTDELPSG